MSKNTDHGDPSPQGAKALPRLGLAGLSKWQIFKWALAAAFILTLITIMFVGVYVIRATRDLPTLDALRDYSPPVMSRVQAGDGKLIAEYGIEKRVFVPIESIPKTLQYALVASEDQRFFEHKGFDGKGFTRAMIANVGHVLKNERLEGGSTLTQQVAKNFLVGNERNVARKIREVFIAKRIEKAIGKDEILELYLNEVYFGRRAYGIAGASLNYFDKPLSELSLGQSAYLAGLVKGPNNYQPDKDMEKAINRRNSVLNRMVDDGYITPEEAAKAKQEPLIIAERLYGAEYLAAEYFVSEVRKQIGQMYGEEQLNEGGLSIRTTLDTQLQLAAHNALRKGLNDFDRRHGYRGPLGAIDIFNDWPEALAAFDVPGEIEPWRVAVVLSQKGGTAKIGLVGPDPVEGEKREVREGTLSVKDLAWAKPILSSGRLGKSPKAIADILAKGDVILVEAKPVGKNKSKKSDKETAYNLRQIPVVNGGLIAMDPHTGRVLALVGGYSFEQSQFNRATQAYRQPGSAFKPFVYSAALDSGFTPVSQILDAPFIIERKDNEQGCEHLRRSGFDLRFGSPTDDGQDDNPEIVADEQASSRLSRTDEECGPIYYKPANFNAGKFYGLSTLRLGLEKSRNAMTVRLANDIGMTIIGKYSRRFGIYDEPRPELAWSLGAGETTLMRLSAAYAALVNGGKKVQPTLLDRVQDNKGRTIFINDQRVCAGCFQDEYTGAPPPELPDDREEVLSPVTAYQITSMLEGVVQRGTGWRAKRLGRPIAGKTGTTNDYKDAWFMGFSPDLVAGVYVGYDTPRSMGTETGSSAAAPIFTDFMEVALKSQPKAAFRIPDGVLLAPVDRVSGEPSYIGAPNYLLEAFKPGTEPKVGETRSKINIGTGEGFDRYNFDFDTDETDSADEGDEGETISENSDEDEEGGTDTDAQTDADTDVVAENGSAKDDLLDNSLQTADGEEREAVLDVVDIGDTVEGAADVTGEGVELAVDVEPDTPPLPNTEPEISDPLPLPNPDAEPETEPEPEEEIDLDDGLY